MRVMSLSMSPRLHHCAPPRRLRHADCHASVHPPRRQGAAVMDRTDKDRPAFIDNDAFQCGYCTPGDPAPGAAPDTSKSQRKSRCGLCERAPGRSEALTLRNVSAARRVFDEPAIPVGCKQLIAPARARAPSRQPSLPSVPVASASK
jgi:hypothetical protein